MNGILKLGKYLFALPFAIFAINHFMYADMMAGYAPFGGKIMVYITGLALLAAVVSILIGKMDKLATALLGLMLLIFALSIHLPGVMEETTRMASMPNLLKDTSLAGAAWIYASSAATDNSVIG